MPYERAAGSSAGRWTMVLGLCLAAIAAGSFIAFSLVARDATRAGLDIPVAAVTSVTAAPPITFAPPGRGSRDGRDPVRRSTNGRDLVLGTRFDDDGPVETVGGFSPEDPSGGASDCRPRCGGGSKTPDADKTPNVVPARPTTGGKGKGKVNGNGGPPPSAGPSPNGKAKGHIKAKGKGHDKHPEDH